MTAPSGLMKFDHDTVRLLFEPASHGMALIRVEGRFDYVNPAFSRMLGYTTEELCRLSYLQVTHAEDAEHGEELAQILLDGEKESVTTEKRYVAKSGRTVYCRVDTALIRDESGRPSFFFSQVTDISNRRRDGVLLQEERRLMEMVAKGEELNAFLRHLVGAVKGQMEDARVCLFLVRNDNRTLHLHTALELPPPIAMRLIQLEVRAESGIVSRCAFLNRRIVTADLGRDPDLGTEAGSEALRSGWAFPIRSRTNLVVGVLALFFSGERDPDPRELDQVERAIRIAGIGIEREHADRLLRESEERYALALRGANDGIWDWDVGPDRLYVSQRWRAIVGLAAGDVLSNGRDWIRRLHPADRRPTYIRLRAHLEGLSAHFEAEYRMRQRDGSYRWVLSRGVAQRDRDGRPYRMAGSLSDVTERKAAEARLEYEALHDALTDLPNRSFFVSRLERSLREQTPGGFAVLFLNLDRFKQVNDSLGNEFGDRLLTAVGARLRTVVGTEHLLARMGGDEFTVLVESANAPAQAEELAGRLVSALAESFRIQDYDVSTGASVGLVVAHAEYQRPEEVLRDADAAVSRAKERGRSCVVVFDQKMQARALEAARIEGLIRRALLEDGLVLYYQPIVELSGRRVVGCEALLRVTLPEAVGISPETVIRVAEETGLILSLGEWVFREACAFASRLMDAGMPDIRVAINVSPKQFRHTGFPTRVAEILRETGVTGNCITLELTEGLFLGFEDEVLASLTRLQELGFQLSIDDFGTGYSSLSYLKRLPIDLLKIDRSFVGGIPQDEEGAAISAAVIALGHILQIRVVAEGVERPEQIEFLAGFECDYIQGYAVSKALSEAEFMDFVRRSRTLDHAVTGGYGNEDV